MIGRRQALRIGFLGLGVAIAGSADACTLVATRKPVSFRNNVCEAKIRKLVAFANIAHDKSDDEIADWQEKNELNLSYGGGLHILKEMRVSDEKIDPQPIRLSSIELIRQVKNKATYVFALRRNQYFAADEEGCNGMFAHDEYYADTETAFVATFENNQFVGFKEFPEWYV